MIDVRDPKNPKTVKYVAAPHNTWSLHLQTHEDLLLVINNKDMFAQPDLADEKAYYKGAVDKHAQADATERDWSAGSPSTTSPSPTILGGSASCRWTERACTGWYTGGRWAYASALIDGFSDYILITIDMADPTRRGSPASTGRRA